MGSQCSTYELHSTSTFINKERGVSIQSHIHGFTMVHLHATQHIHRQREARKRVRGTPQSNPLFRLTHSATDGFTSAIKSTRNTIEETGCRLGTAFVGFTNRVCPCTSPARFRHPIHPEIDVLGSPTFDSAGDSAVGPCSASGSATSCEHSRREAKVGFTLLNTTNKRLLNSSRFRFILWHLGRAISSHHES